MVRTVKLTTPLFGLRREIDKLFEDAYGNVNTPLLPAHSWLPLGDVRETNDALLFDLELPGVSEEKLEITCEDGVLTIAGQKEAAKTADDAKTHIVERSFGSFRRSFQLPMNVQDDKIDATVKDGVLTVKVPKMEMPKPKRIEVKARKSGE